MDNSAKKDLAVFKAKSLSFSYNDKHPALDNLSFEIYPGDFVLLCGRSGSGKTTLLRHLKAITPRGKKSGQLYYCHEQIDSIERRRLVSEIGFVFQSPDDQIVCDHVFPELAFGLENLGVPAPEIKRRIAEMSGFFGIENLMQKDINTLSGGQRQMVNLAAVMIMHPKVLLLDEPSSQLDPVYASEFFSMLTRLNRELGITIVISEHRLEEIYSIADKIMLLDRGRLLKYSSPSDTAAYILDNNHKMKHALPSASRIAYKIDQQYRPIPLTVKEGREFISNIFSVNFKKEDMHFSLPSNSLPAIKAKGVYFRYKKDLPDIVASLSLKAMAGEITCLFGGNGAGKTTALRLFCRVLKPYRGKIQLNGKPVKQKQAVYMPQNPLTMFVKDTIKDDLNYLAKSNGFGWDKVQKVIDGYSFFEELIPLLDQNPMDLSGGELQKAAFLKIRLLSPKVILLDEPTKGLDAFSKYDLAIILRELASEGICIIMATHDIEFAAEYANRCVMLFDGQIVSEDISSKFFSSNHYYTTAANKICRQFLPEAITVGDVIKYASE